MRILHVLEAVGGGTMRHLEELVASTDAEHHVACPVTRSTDLSHPDPTGALRAAGATVHIVPMSRRLPDLANLKAIRQLSVLIDELQPDVIHAHASVAGALARLAAHGRVPVIWTPHAVHDRKLFLQVERLLSRFTSAVVALSPSESQAITGAHLSPERKLHLIPNGIAVEANAGELPTRASLGLPADVQIIGFIGRLCAQKAPEDFIETARQVLAYYPEAHAVLVGTGPLQDSVLAAASTLPADRFHHLICDEGAEKLIALFDVLVMPSRYEGGPYLPLEAMRAGVPVVASNSSGMRDYVINEVSGLTVPVGDVDGFAEATGLLLTAAQLRDGIIASAQIFVKDRHNLVDMAHAYETLYASLLPVSGLLPATRTPDLVAVAEDSDWPREHAAS